VRTSITGGPLQPAVIGPRQRLATAGARLPITFWFSRHGLPRSRVVPPSQRPPAPAAGPRRARVFSTAVRTGRPRRLWAGGRRRKPSLERRARPLFPAALGRDRPSWTGSGPSRRLSWVLDVVLLGQARRSPSIGSNRSVLRLEAPPPVARAIPLERGDGGPSRPSLVIWLIRVDVSGAGPST